MAANGAGGTLGLVNDLSVKLQKQRKQLNALVKEVKSSQAAELRWWDYAGIVFCNNVTTVIFGFILFSLLLGVGPADGSFSAGQITTTGLTVSGPLAEQEVRVQSTQSNSTVIVQSPAESSLVLVAGGDEALAPRFKWGVARGDRLTLTQDRRTTPELAIRPAKPGFTNVTDVAFSPGGGTGTVVVSQNLELTGSTIATRNGSLTLRPALDGNIGLRPTAGGRVDIHSAVALEERLKVSKGTDAIQVDVNPRANTVALGVDSASRLMMHGTANLSSSCTERQISSGTDSRSVRPCHVIDGGNLNILNGNMILGNANINTEGSLSVAGDVNFGSSANDTLEIQGSLTMTNGTDTKVSFHPLTGSAESRGNLVVDRMADLRSSVIMGSDPSDTVTIYAKLTSLHNLNATGSAVLGAVDSDNVQLFGDLAVVANASNPVPILSVNGTVGDIFSDCDMYVTRSVRLDGSVTIGNESGWPAGDPGDNSSHMLTSSVETMFQSPVKFNQTLRVDGDARLSDLIADECVLRGPLGVGAHADDFTVDHATGDMYVFGVATIEKSGVFQSNVSMGQGKRHRTTVGGDTKMRSTLHSKESFSVGEGMKVEGELIVGGSLFVGQDHTVVGDVYLGKDASQRSTVHGRLLVESQSKLAVLDIDPSGGDINIDGRLTVQRETELDGTTLINASAVINGGAVLEGLLIVEKDLVVARNGHVGERIVVKKEMTVAANLTVDGPATLGSGPDKNIEIHGHLFVQAEDSSAPLLTVSPSPSGVHITDTLRVQSSVRFDDKLDIGNPQDGQVTVLASTLVNAPIEALGTVQVDGQLKIREPVTLNDGVTVRGDTVLGHRDTSGSNVVTVSGDLVLTDGAETRVHISDDSGNVELWSDLHVQGNLELGDAGIIDTPRFVVGSLNVKDIRERSTDQGVNVEGVVFVDGGIKFARVHEMREVLPTKGVTLEGANCKAGALVLTAGSGTNDIDALTLTNHNHQQTAMANTTTRLAWEQYFHDSREGTQVNSEVVYHSEAGAASLAVTTVGDWTDDPITQNAKISFETAWKGVVAERARISPEGDFVIDGRVQLDAENGDIVMAGDLYIGAGAYRCALPSTGATGGALNPGFGSCNVCSACCMDLAQAECDECVAKRCASTDGSRSLDIVSEAEMSSMILESGGSGSTTIKLTSGDFATPASFSFINTADVGTTRAEPTLRIVDSKTNQPEDLLVLTARPAGGGGGGNVGNLYVSGSLIIGELNTTQTQTLEQSVGLSGGAASLSATSIGAHDASITITSGPNQRAYLQLQDPADGGQGNGFWLFNDGTKGMNPVPPADPLNPPIPIDLWLVDNSGDTGFPTLRITNEMSASLLSAYDQGDTGTLQLNGDFAIGGPDSVGSRVLTVQSDAESARMNVIGGTGADALVSITAGENQRAVVLLGDPNGKFFSIGPHTETHKLMFGWGLDADNEFALVNITRTSGGEGLMHVSGSGVVGNLDTLAPCVVGVVSGAQAELLITAGDGAFGASATLTSGRDQSSSLVLSVQSLPTAIGTHEELFALELTNDGSAAVPTLELKHQGTQLLTLTDQGQRGDLAVSGNLILGDRYSDSSRGLTIESQARADLILVSGAGSDSVLQIMSGWGDDAQLRLEDTRPGNAATFIFKNSGTDQALKIVDATDRLMLAFHDRGDSGDLEATGDAVFGAVDAPNARALTIKAGTEAKLDVTAGPSSDAGLSLLSGGATSTASFELRSNKTGFLVYTGGSESAPGDNMLRIAVPVSENAHSHSVSSTSSGLGSDLQDIISVIDRGPTGDLVISGDVVIGDIHGKESFVGDKWLKITSHGASSLAVNSGDFDDASIEILSGPGQNSEVTLEQLLLDGTEGAKFTVGLNHAGAQPTLEVTNANVQLLVVTDRGSTGDLTVTGNGAFGSPPDSLGAILDNKLDLLGAYAALEVTAGQEDPAVLSLSSGDDAMAALRMATHETSFYELRNVGNGLTKRMEIHTQDSNILQVTDLGDRSQLAFVGDVDIGTTNSSVDIALTVESAQESRVGIQAGAASQAVLELQSGRNRVSEMTLISKTTVVSGSDIEFRITLDGGETGDPRLQWKDGATSVMTIIDTGITGDVQAVAIACASYSTTGDTTLGDSTQDAITISGHIVNTALHFDGDGDDVSLVLRFEDPAASSTITFPDESGTVLTTASSYSMLGAIGELASGAIAEGFGSVSTASNIETVGATSSITAAGTVTSQSNFVARGNIYLGDEATDDVSFRGVVQESFRFIVDKGVQFHDSNGGAPAGKTTWIKAAFDALSLPGPREIVIPDVSIGGALHVVSNILDPAQISNVNQVSMDTTAGKIMAPSDLVLLPMDDATFHLVNRRITSSSVVMASICDDQNVGLAGGAWVMVTAVKVNVNGGGCAIVVHNVHPTNSKAAQVGFNINFSVFNAS